MQREDRLRAGVSWIGSEFVFTTEAGTALDPRNVSRWFDNVVRATLGRGSLQTLRHSALTAMVLGGVPLPVVSRIAGHESITTTIDLYGHVSDESARDAMSVAASALGLA